MSNNQDTTERDLHKLTNKRASIEVDYQHLHDSVKHHDYDKLQKYSEKFTKEVMAYLNDVRHVKEQLNGHQADQEVIDQINHNVGFMEELKAYLDELKALSKSYKGNELFKHSPELRRIMENEDTRIIELEQALNSVTGML